MARYPGSARERANESTGSDFAGSEQTDYFLAGGPHFEDQSAAPAAHL
jgi:hypothetical protein